MRVSKLLLFAIAFSTMSLTIGCAAIPKQPTREESLQMTSRVFPNTTVDAVLEAGGNVLTLSDPSDVTVQHLPNKMTAIRKVLLWAVLTSETVIYTFQLTATQDGNNVQALLTIDQTFGYGNRRREVYDLYFDRVSTLLYGTDWRTCLDRDPGVIITIALEPLCAFADDNVPEGAKLSPKSQKAKDVSLFPQETNRR
jgi:hypothetical protein